MRLDSLSRLIEASDFLSFREIALKCLALKGYREVALTDGWRDGGTDVRTFDLPPNPTPIAFQITVEWDWKAKLRADARKVKANLKLEHMTLMTSRRVPEAEFHGEAENLWRELGVRVTKIDSQAIASAFFLAGKSTLVLESVGIEVSGPGAKPARTVRSDAAYSFVFFGKETHRFREAIVESAVISVLARNPRCAREKTVAEVATLLALPESQHGQVDAVIDRMLQRGDIHGPAATLLLSTGLTDAAQAMEGLRVDQQRQLRKQVAETIARYGRMARPQEEAVEAVMEDLGALLLDTAKAAISPTRRQVVADPIQNRLRHLHSTLDAFGLAALDRDNAVAELAALAVNSPLGSQLLAGELFLSIGSAKTPSLIQALGARGTVEILLDASVAIPMVCGLLFRPTSTSFSYGAQHAYSQIGSHGLTMTLPDVYLEEACAHLVAAWRKYEVIAELDPDLERSENAFVANFAGLRAGGGPAIAFSDYVQAFGLDASVRGMEFYAARDALVPRLQRLFDRYGIVVRAVGHSSGARRRAEESIAHAIHELNIERPKVVLRHDAQVLGHLFTRDASTETACVLCTWDSLHFWIREHEDAFWEAMNPAMLGDLL
jgi:hypothetical protein